MWYVPDMFSTAALGFSFCFPQPYVWADDVG